MFTLRIFVMGLVALVSSKDMTHLTLVLPELRTAAAGKHYPVLVYPCGPATSTTCNARDASLVYQELNLPTGNFADGRLFWNGLSTFGAVDLKGVELSLSPASSGDLVFFLGSRKRSWQDMFGAVPRSVQEGSDTSWLPRMKDLSPHAALFSWRKMNTPSADAVAGVMRLSGINAEVRVFSFSTLVDDDGVERIYSLTFKKKGTSPMVAIRQALPDVLEVDLLVDNPYIDLVISPLDGTAGYSLQLQPQPGQKLVDVLLGNLVPVSSEDIKRGDNHFDMYYNLAENQETDDKVGLEIGTVRVDSRSVVPDFPDVVRVVSQQSVTGSGLSRPICTFVVFDATP